MPRLFLLVFSAGLAVAQSHPEWWTFVAPDASSLLGIQWSKLQDSPFADALAAELFGDGIGLADLACLRRSRDFLISSTPVVAAANGGCTASALRDEAAAKGMRPVLYRGFTIWSPQTKSAFSVVQYLEPVTLIGPRRSLEAAIDRAIENRTADDKSADHIKEDRAKESDRHYSPLLIGGARLARTRDLWVVANQLPDPLASLFVPLDLDAREFEGGIGVRDGLDLGAIFNAGSETAAREAAEKVRGMIPSLPSVAKALQVVTNGSTIVLALDVSRADFLAGMQQPRDSMPSAPPVPSLPPVITPGQATPASRSQTVPGSEGVAAIALPALSAPPARPSAPVPVTAAVPVTGSPAKSTPETAASQDTSAEKRGAVSAPVSKSEPQVIRIYGLDDGVREIVLPPIKTPQKDDKLPENPHQ